MSNAIPICGRCGKPVSDDSRELALEKELPDSVREERRLCPSCIESFNRWYRKYTKPSSRRAPRLEPEGTSAPGTAFGLKQSKRRHRRKKQIQRVLVVTSLTILVFLISFYWTWTALKTATRVEE